LVEIPALAGETELTNLTGLPLAAQVARAGKLPDKLRSFTLRFSSMMEEHAIQPLMR